MVIDAFCHIIPPRYYALLKKMAGAGKIPSFDSLTQGEFVVPGMIDVPERLRLMETTPEVADVLSVTGPFLENIAGPGDAVELARLANDEVAELVAKYPNRFVAAVALLPLNDIETSLREIDRSIKELHLRGIQMGTDVHGRPLDSPEFLPIYEKMQQYDLPIFIHPSKNVFASDYPGESEYNRVVGWPHATSLAMLRLVHYGVFDKYPRLKFVTHHAGGTVPSQIKRIETNDRFKLPRPIVDYLRLFYADTAVQGNTPNLMCAQALFGADHLVFGTDFPFNTVAPVLDSVEEMVIPAGEKKKIFEDNIKKLLRL